jgi:hypothetical protein
MYEEGNNPISQAIGLEFDLGEGWKISEEGRF